MSSSDKAAERGTPPGWPGAVRPPGAPGWERTASTWLFDLCPADFRGYPVLTRQPLVLAWAAGRYVESAGQGTRSAISRVRAELTEVLDAGTLEQVVELLEAERARLLAAARGVELVRAALRGERYVPRL